MFVSDAAIYQSGAPSRVDSWPNHQTLDLAVKDLQVKTLWLIRTFLNCGYKKFYNFGHRCMTNGYYNIQQNDTELSNTPQNGT